MRLSVFHYPIEGWTDAVAMNLPMGRATMIRLDEFARVSCQPLGEAFRAILPRETRHAELGEEGLRRIVADQGGRGPARFEAAHRFGLRQTMNEDLLERWRGDVGALLSDIGLKAG